MATATGARALPLEQVLRAMLSPASARDVARLGRDERRAAFDSLLTAFRALRLDGEKLADVCGRIGAAEVIAVARGG